MLGSLAQVMAWALAAFTVVRFLDLGVRGKLGLLGTFDLYTGMFLLETALFLLPALVLLSPKRRADAGCLFRASMKILILLRPGGYGPWQVPTQRIRHWLWSLRSSWSRTSSSGNGRANRVTCRRGLPALTKGIQSPPLWSSRQSPVHLTIF